MDVSRWSTVMFMSHHKGSVHHFSRRVALLICKVHVGACTNWTSTKTTACFGKLKNLPWCSQVSLWFIGCKYKMSIQFSFMNPLCITFFFYCLTSDARSQNKHSSYQIIVQTAAQMKNMMDRLALRHCHTVQANTGTLSSNCCDILFFLFPITDWWSGSNRKLIKSILYLRHVSIDLAHPSAVINGRIRWYNLAGLQRYGEESGNLSEKEKKLPKQNTDKSRQWRWSRTQGGAAGIARWGNRGGGIKGRAVRDS